MAKRRKKHIKSFEEEVDKIRRKRILKKTRNGKKLSERDFDDIEDIEDLFLFI